jgi:hypothetical protein
MMSSVKDEPKSFSKVNLSVAVKACMSCKHVKQEISGYDGSYSSYHLCVKHFRPSGVGFLTVAPFTVCDDYEVVDA